MPNTTKKMKHSILERTIAIQILSFWRHLDDALKNDLIFFIDYRSIIERWNVYNNKKKWSCARGPTVNSVLQIRRHAISGRLLQNMIFFHFSFFQELISFFLCNRWLEIWNDSFLVSTIHFIASDIFLSSPYFTLRRSQRQRRRQRRRLRRFFLSALIRYLPLFCSFPIWTLVRVLWLCCKYSYVSFYVQVFCSLAHGCCFFIYFYSYRLLAPHLQHATQLRLVILMADLLWCGGRANVFAVCFVVWSTAVAALISQHALYAMYMFCFVLFLSIFHSLLLIWCVYSHLKYFSGS